MKKQLLKIPIIIFSLILLIFFYLLIIDRNPNEIPSNLLNKKIPNFQTASLLKKEKFISTNEFGNEIILVNFFATWCKPCRDEHKYIKLFSEEKNLFIRKTIYFFSVIEIFPREEAGLSRQKRIGS